MKNLLSVWFIIYFALSVYPQQWDVIQEVSSNYFKWIERKVPAEGLTTYRAGDCDWGFEEQSGDKYYYRSCYVFSTDHIPNGATDIVITLKVKSQYGDDYNAFVKYVPNNNTYNNDEDLFNEISNNGVKKTTIHTDQESTADVKTDYVNKASNNEDLLIGIQEYNTTTNHAAFLSYIKLEIKYNIDIGITVKNNFNGGDVGVGVNGSPQRVSSPHTVSAKPGDVIYLTNYDNQNGNDGYVYLWNDSEAPEGKSKWRIDGEDYEDMTYSFTVEPDDNGLVVEPKMKKNYKISRDDRTEFDGLVEDNGTSWMVEQNSGNVSYPSTQTINSHTYNFAGWIGTSGTNLTPTDNMTVTARYKMKNRSNNINSFNNNNQVKVYRAGNGTEIFKVYESMGKVWLEKSTDNGGSWTMENNGLPIVSEDAKSPSMCTDAGGNVLLIALQSKYGSASQIKLLIYDPSFNEVVDEAVVGDIAYESYSGSDASPVVAYGFGSSTLSDKGIVAWREGYQNVLYPGEYTLPFVHSQRL